MEVPGSAWPEGPWSPVGYQVVVTDESVPRIEDGPQPDCHSREREPSEPPLRPWALAGYRVVEVVEEPSPGPRRRRSASAGTPKKSPPRKVRPLVRWVAVGFGTFIITAAVALASLRLPPWTRGAGALTVPWENNLPDALQCPAGDGWGAARETYGTAVGFVRSPAEAARIAAQEQKLTFLLHVSGNFDDPGLT